jgi:regulator of RNase E activity RraA
MKKYLVIFEDRNGTVVSNFEIKAENIQKAKDIAQFHKRRTPEVQEAKGVKTTVKRLAD